MQIPRFWRGQSQRYRLTGVKYKDGTLAIQPKYRAVYEGLKNPDDIYGATSIEPSPKREPASAAVA